MYVDDVIDQDIINMTLCVSGCLGNGDQHPEVISHLCWIWTCSGGAGGIAARGQINMGASIGVVEIHLRAKLPPL